MNTASPTQSPRTRIVRPVLIAAAIVLGLAALVVTAREDSLPLRQDQPAAVRIGTYDSRAIGLAYGRSKAAAKDIDDLMAEHKAALAAGDADRARDLEKKGASRQIRRHLQVFSNAPVEDALGTIREQLPGVAQRMNVVAIAPTLDFHAPAVESVDVTDELVRLFDPTPETLKFIAECRRQKPLPIEEVAQIPADK